jgi:hypothetical protein
MNQQEVLRDLECAHRNIGMVKLRVLIQNLLNPNVQELEEKVADKEITFRYDPTAIDSALMELLATIFWLSGSPKFIELEKVIRGELSSSS